MRTTVGQLMINDVLPDKYRDYGRTLDRKGMKDLALRISQDDPDAYREVMYKLHRIGGDVAHATGGSFRPSDMRPDPITRKQLESVRARVRDLVNDDTLDDDQRAEAIQNVVLGSIDPIEKSLYDEGLKNGNVLALQVHSGSRGKKADIRAIAAGEFMVADHKNRVIPMPILRGYSEGLSPAEQWAASYGTRKGQAATKLLVADAGYFCLEENTLVRMADMSVRKISELFEGDMVAGADDSGRRVSVRVSGVCDAGVKPVWRWTFRRGSSRSEVVAVDATEEHEVYAHARRGRGSIVPSMYPLKRMRNTYSLLPVGPALVPLPAVEWRAFLLGALLGDGGLTGNNTMFSCADAALASYMSAYLGERGYVFDQVRRSKGPLYEYVIREQGASALIRGPGGRVVGGAHRDPLRQWLDDLGVLGKRANEKCVPGVVFTWPEGDVVEFVSGLLETDGSVRTVNGCPEVRFAVTSRELAEGLMRLLEVKLGVYATGIHVVDNVGKVRVRTDYAGKVRKLKHNYPAYGFSVSNGESVRRLVSVVPARGCKLGKLRALVDAQVRSGRVAPFSYGYIGREFIGNSHTFDIEVDHPAHRFVLANGMVVGNSKKIMQAAHRQVVTEPDCKTEAGIPVDAQDPDNAGAVLARSAGGVPAGTVIDAEVMRKLGDQKILVRSPMTCSAENGVCAHCAGIRERGTFPDIGDNIGIMAAQAVGEKVSQGSLSSKHGGGRATKETSAERLGGLPLLTQFIDLPSEFRDAATLAQMDGEVESVDDAPQGGKNIVIDGEVHYVKPGFNVMVKPGQQVQRGQQLSEGWINPVETTQMKGLGAARLQLVQSYRDALKANGVQANRRNLEVIARGLLNHVRITDLDGTEGLPGDVTEYGALSRTYRPRYGFRQVPARKSVGMYLEKPALYHTIGTKVTKDIADELEEFGVKDVVAHEDPPPFEPTAVRAMETSMRSPDWQVRFGGSYLQKGLLEAAQRGRDSELHSTSFVPPLMKAVDFGKDLRTKGVY